MNLTLGQVRPTVALGLGMCAIDERIPYYVNKAIQSLMTMGRWKGTVARYNVCLNQACLTLPMELETLLSGSICKHNMYIRNQWFEFMSNGPSPQDCRNFNFNSENIYDRGDGYVTIYDIETPSYIRVFADLPEDAGALITLMGYDENNNPIKTLVSGEYIDGEQVGIDNATPQTSVRQFSKLVQVVKPRTNGIVRLYAVNPTTTAQSLLAIYNYNITSPSYRRYFIGRAQGVDTAQFEALCFKRFIPVVDDNDLLLIQHEEALKEMCQCVMKREKASTDKLIESKNHMDTALAYLRGELKQYEQTRSAPMQVQITGFAPGLVRQQM